MDVASADAIQDISGYVGTMSDYDIPILAAIISAGDTILDAAGVDVLGNWWAQMPMMVQ